MAADQKARLVWAGLCQAGQAPRLRPFPLTKPPVSGTFSRPTHYLPLTRERKQNIVPVMFTYREAGMLKVFVEEAAALASIVLFVGMIAVWAQLLPQL